MTLRLLILSLLLAAQVNAQGGLVIGRNTPGATMPLTLNALRAYVPFVLTNQSNARGTSVKADFQIDLQDSADIQKTYWYNLGGLYATVPDANASPLKRPQDSLLNGPDVTSQLYTSFLASHPVILPIHRGGAGICNYASSYFNYSPSGVHNADGILQAGLSFVTDTTNGVVVIFSGENEAETPNGDTCNTNFHTYLVQEINDLRAAAGKDMFVVVMKVHQYPAAINAIQVQNEQELACQIVGNCVTINTDGLTSSVHFDAADYVYLTGLIAEQWRQYIIKPKLSP